MKKCTLKKIGVVIFGILLFVATSFAGQKFEIKGDFDLGIVPKKQEPAPSKPAGDDVLIQQQDTIVSLREDVQRLTQELADRDKKINGMRSAVMAANELKRERDSFQRAAIGQAKDMEVLTNRIRQLEEQLAEANGKADGYSNLGAEKLAEKVAEINNLLETNRGLEEQIKGLQNDNALLQAEVNRLKGSSGSATTFGVDPAKFNQAIETIQALAEIVSTRGAQSSGGYILIPVIVCGFILILFAIGVLMAKQNYVSKNFISNRLDKLYEGIISKLGNGKLDALQKALAGLKDSDLKGFNETCRLFKALSQDLIAHLEKNGGSKNLLKPDNLIDFERMRDDIKNLNCTIVCPECQMPMLVRSTSTKGHQFSCPMKGGRQINIDEYEKIKQQTSAPTGSVSFTAAEKAVKNSDGAVGAGATATKEAPMEKSLDPFSITGISKERVAVALEMFRDEEGAEIGDDSADSVVELSDEEIDELDVSEEPPDVEPKK